MKSISFRELAAYMKRALNTAPTPPHALCRSRPVRSLFRRSLGERRRDLCVAPDSGHDVTQYSVIARANAHLVLETYLEELKKN